MRHKFEVGEVYNRWTIIEVKKEGKKTTVIAKCECGTIKAIEKSDVKSGKSKGCIRCRFRNKEVLTKKYGKWTPLHFDEESKSGGKIICKCDCGNVKSVSIYNLTSGNSKSCGCEFHGKPIHGMGNTKFYYVWCAMKNRCDDSNNPYYKDYGGRGITYCDRWKYFINFRDDMYEDYLKHNELYNGDTSIDRIDVNGNYEPSNCRWATMKEQNMNKRNNNNNNNNNN